MTSSADSPMPQKPSSGQTLRLRIPGRMPSWNAVLGLNHWRRLKLKHEQQDAFISALSLSENDSATRTICARSTCSTVSDIAVRFREMSQIKSLSKLPKGKP